MPIRTRRLKALAASLVPLLAGAAALAADPKPAPAVAAPAADAELPPLRAGLWEYRRTLLDGQAAKPQVATLRKCADPAVDIREKLAELRRKNCQFTPRRKSNDRYLSSWTCPTAHGPARFRDVLIVKDAGSYQDVIEMRSGQRVSEQRIEATRVGECPGPGARTPPPATSK